MGTRRRARECALQILYQIDTSGQGVEEAFQDMRESFHTDDARVLGYAETLVRGVMEHREAIDALIQRHSPNWKVERMGRVDRNVLRLATFELKWRPDVPMKVVINEAIEVGKRFGNEDSHRFINGVLDKVAKELRREAPE